MSSSACLEFVESTIKNQRSFDSNLVGGTLSFGNDFVAEQVHDSIKDLDLRGTCKTLLCEENCKENSSSNVDCKETIQRGLSYSCITDPEISDELVNEQNEGEGYGRLIVVIPAGPNQYSNTRYLVQLNAGQNIITKPTTNTARVEADFSKNITFIKMLKGMQVGKATSGTSTLLSTLSSMDTVLAQAQVLSPVNMTKESRMSSLTNNKTGIQLAPLDSSGQNIYSLDINAKKSTASMTAHWFQTDILTSKSYNLQNHKIKNVIPEKTEVITSDLKDVKPYKCKLCNEVFSQFLEVGVHMSMAHFTDRPYQCTTCGKRFTSNRSLEKHFRCHSEEPISRPFVCTTCQKDFTDKDYLKRHMMIHVDDNTVLAYMCDKCGKRFLTYPRLKKHLQTHSHKKLFICPVCNKEYTLQSTLRKHLRSHTGERPYTCPTCSRGFTDKFLLTKHKRTHTGERPYICKVCNKGLCSSFALHGHMRLHTGERPYICSTCGIGFNHNVTLRKHQSSHEELIFEAEDLKSIKQEN